MSPSIFRTFFPVALEELLPYEGRLAAAVRIASVCSLTSMVFMVYGIPLAAIACYLVIFVMKPNISESMLMSIGICILVSFVIGLLVLFTQWSADREILRMAILAGTSFIFLYLGVASKLGPAGSIIALVIAFVMTLVGHVPVGEVATRAILYAWLMSTAPMGILLTFVLVFAPSPGRIARADLAKRMDLIAQLLDSPAESSQWLKLLREGNGDLQKTMKFVKLFSLLPRPEVARLNKAVNASYMLLAAAETAHRHGVETSEHPAYAAYCRQLSQALAAGEELPSADANVRAALPADAKELEALEPLRQQLACFPELPAMPDQDQVQPPPKGFLNPDASTNRTYSEYAFKATFAAIACYVIYTAVQWQDIHTALITCYVVALGTTGETVHKLTLRIIGCLIGASFGMLSILFIIPHISSIGALMVLVFGVTLIAGWVASGSERSAYAGVQIGLAFLLTILQGFGPEVKLDVAMDRIFGILLGNFMMYLVFTRVWPVSASQTAADQLKDMGIALTNLLNQPVAVTQTWTDLQRTLPKIEAIRDQLAMNHYEPKTLRRTDEQERALQEATIQMEQLYLDISFAPAGVIPADEKARAKQISEQLVILANPIQ